MEKTGQHISTKNNLFIFYVFLTAWQACKVVRVTGLKLEHQRLTEVRVNVSINGRNFCQNVLKLDTFHAISTLTVPLNYEKSLRHSFTFNE